MFIPVIEWGSRDKKRFVDNLTLALKRFELAIKNDPVSNHISKDNLSNMLSDIVGNLGRERSNIDNIYNVLVKNEKDENAIRIANNIYMTYNIHYQESFAHQHNCDVHELVGNSAHCGDTITQREHDVKIPPEIIKVLSAIDNESYVAKTTQLRYFLNEWWEKGNFNAINKVVEELSYLASIHATDDRLSKLRRHMSNWTPTCTKIILQGFIPFSPTLTGNPLLSAGAMAATEVICKLLETPAKMLYTTPENRISRRIMKIIEDRNVINNDMQGRK